MSVTAIITARGGSKRIHKKNIKSFMGKPMLAYAIEAALNSGIFDEVMVSTDDKEIAEIAIKYGAAVPFMRSKRTASDTATTFEVLDEVVQEYAKLGKNIDTICCIYPCVPFLKSETLKTAFESLKGHDAVMPVCRFSVPVEWAMRINEKKQLIPDNREAQNIRSQDMKPSYYDVGMFYFCKTDKLYQHNSLVPDDTVAYVVSEMECQDIDNESDWLIAEMKYQLLNKRSS